MCHEALHCATRRRTLPPCRPSRVVVSDRFSLGAPSASLGVECHCRNEKFGSSMTACVFDRNDVFVLVKRGCSMRCQCMFPQFQSDRLAPCSSHRSRAARRLRVRVYRSKDILLLWYVAVGMPRGRQHNQVVCSHRSASAMWASSPWISSSTPAS